MGYQALYRVWRPQTFADVVGQETITQTLKNALVTKHISHAYLFTGPRGTGKTSMAKILAKAVNCHYLKDGEPCNECETCRAITDGSLSDVIEIDAASNNGVEEIRDIRDKVKYAPTLADFKVYIIDEVHMLSTGAFNALLKTLEEPPANVIFILATTEPYKVPATIISRTQRFNFQRILPQAIFDRMAHILNEKEIEFDPKALRVIAKTAEGGMRDALSILDQVLSFGDNQVTLENAIDVTGTLQEQVLVDYLNAILNQETTVALTAMQNILESGKDHSRLLEEMINYCRDLLLYQQSPETVERESLGMVDENLIALSQAFSSDRLYQMIEILNDTQQSLRFTNHPAVFLEVMTVKLSQPNVTTTAVSPTVEAVDQHAEAEVNELKTQIDQLKQTLEHLQQGQSVAPAPTKTAPAKKTASNQNVKFDVKGIYAVLHGATRQDLEQDKEIWPDIIDMMTVTQRAWLKVSEPVAASENGLVLAFQNEFLYQRASQDQDLIQQVQVGLNKILHREIIVQMIPQTNWIEIRKNYINDAQPESESEPKQDDPVVSEAKELFGADNIEIQNN